MEIEIKFRVPDVEQLETALRAAGFREQTSRTHEMNWLYDLPSGALPIHVQTRRWQGRHNGD